jgi:outer membrane protein assembly factor BamB
VISKNNMATPSAATDGKVVAALAGTGRLAVYDFAGKELWSRDLAREFGKFAIKFLPASSPLLFGGRLYVQVLQNERPEIYRHVADDKRPRQSFLLCVDPHSGATLWRQVRQTDATDESQEAYNTPLPFSGRRGNQIVCFGAEYVTGHDAASGTELWRCGSLNEQQDRMWRTISSPVAAGELIVCCLPRAKSPVVAVSGESSGRVPAAGMAWRFTGGSSDVSTPLYYRGKLFVLDGVKSTMICLDPKTGSRQWSGRVGAAETFSASPTGADGKIYCLGEQGTVVVLAAGDEFKIIAKFTMPREAPAAPGDPGAKATGGPIMSSIAVAGGHLFVRTPRTLWCIGPK